MSENADATTVAQWASEIAALAGDWDESNASWDDAVCSSLAAAEAVDCGLLLIAMGFNAEAASTTLNGLQNETGPTYLGEPPDEIGALLDETTQAADAASEAGNAVKCPGDECVSTAFTFERAWDDLGTAYDKWAPYL